MGCAGWNGVIGALDLAQHARKTLAQIMTTPHLDLKVGLSDTKSQVFSFHFVFPFGKAPPSASNYPMNSKLH